jgi:hypothetical protein
LTDAVLNDSPDAEFDLGIFEKGKSLPFWGVKFGLTRPGFQWYKGTGVFYPNLFYVLICLLYLI